MVRLMLSKDVPKELPFLVQGLEHWPGNLGIGEKARQVGEARADNEGLGSDVQHEILLATLAIFESFGPRVKLCQVPPEFIFGGLVHQLVFNFFAS